MLTGTAWQSLRAERGLVSGIQRKDENGWGLLTPRLLGLAPVLLLAFVPVGAGAICAICFAGLYALGFRGRGSESLRLKVSAWPPTFLLELEPARTVQLSVPPELGAGQDEIAIRPRPVAAQAEAEQPQRMSTL